MVLETVSSNTLPDRLHLYFVRAQVKRNLLFCSNWDIIPTSITVTISSFNLGILTLEFTPFHQPTGKFLPIESFKFSYLDLPPPNILEILIQDRFPELCI